MLVLSVNKFLNLKKRDRLPRLTSLPALLTVIKSRYAIPLRYAIKAALGISIFPFFPCPARTKGISFLAMSCRIVNSFNPRISCVHSLMVSISTGCSAMLSAGISLSLTARSPAATQPLPTSSNNICYVKQKCKWYI